MVKIVIDAGHGGHDPGAVGFGMREKDLTLTIALKVQDILIRDYIGAIVKMTRTSDVYLPLAERAKIANVWGADLLLSIHINATPSGYGYEDFIYTGTVNATSIATQNEINAEVIKATNWHNRGKKRKNLQVLRDSKMAAILTESGFIDNPNDAVLLKNDKFLNQVARGHANGIAKAFNLKAKVEPPKEDEELKFSSPALKSETETSLASKAHRQIIVAAAVKAGAHVSWAEKLANGTLTDADVLGLAVKYTVAVNK
ncbi:N-acetylmuramoyl-L-alanine amidase [Sporosarcina sp. ANT_H38]|uniref:N-acetylmuramoyl-L-alanine amidase family protein n=1 Tax=Sporosarcina sp. ANT_H38 TaxID=2597358 RepID=UPI0011F1BE10|nr:N-acetylmuramoyl-L-alanine amidase [Sporosarcina sp. ANT_H38]KAA0944055.1 N-acetylmuramoyl-L-alanine amidase [Sporosarcina sp. ANT_H38]